MWIRSQNLFTLVKCERLFVRRCESDSFCVIEAGVITLGSYSTLNKALKVLDEIQACIMTEHHYHTDDENCTRRFFTKEWKEIYQMPQDEDVEV